MYTLTCPYCNSLGDFEVKAQSREYRFDHCILECSRCGRQLYARVTYQWSKSRPYKRAEPVQVEIYPPVEPTPDERVPAQVAGYYHEAVRAYNAGCYRASMLMCQQALEGVCDSRLSPGRALRVRMEGLLKKGYVGKELYAHLRQVGLLASELSAGLKNVSAGDTELALRYTEELLYRVYVEKAVPVQVGR